MNAVDTNVLIYRLDPDDPEKHAKARDLVRQLRSAPTPTVLLWQVLGEFVRWLRHCEDQGRITHEIIVRYTLAIRKRYSVVFPVPLTLDAALSFAGRFSLSHWDSMVLGACQTAGVTTFYTEDMGAPTRYDGIQLINPFA